jgi:phospholipase C
MPGSTGINRMTMHTAQTDGYTGTSYDGKPMINAKSIYESFEASNLDWALHYHDFTTTHMISPLNTKTDKLKQDFGFESFYSELAEGKLNNYTFLVPLLHNRNNWTANSQHPTYDVRPGELLIKQVYEELRKSERWNDTLLVVTYDEHGGFWDSDNAIPETVNGNPKATASPYAFDFTRMGVRVPTIMVSPWLAPKVDDTIYDHTSVPAMLKSIFNLPNFLTPRDTVANHLDHPDTWLPAPRTDCPMTLPLPPSSAEHPKFERPKVEVDPASCSWDQMCQMHGLEDEMTSMYYGLLISRGLEHKMSMRIGQVLNPDDASYYRLEAIDLLFK